MIDKFKHCQRPIVTLLLILASTACSPPPPVSHLLVSDILGNNANQEFRQVLEKRALVFPKDHGPHPEYKNEWWYLTGNVHDENGRQFGYQVTFFRIALTAGTANPIAHQSAWRTQQVWMAHFAITDIKKQHHVHGQRIVRQALNLAGASTEPVKIWLENWQLIGQKDSQHGFPWQLSVQDEQMSVNFSLASHKPVVLQGDEGLSQKSPAFGNASYYYSLSRLQTQGRLNIGEHSYQVTGTSWLDREWGSSQLSDNQVGWDWFSIQLHDHQELMYYQLRTKDGQAHPSSQGKWINQTGMTQSIRPSDIQLTPLAWWTAEDGKKFPIKWRLKYPSNNSDWIIEAQVADQYMTTLVRYWEGTVTIVDAHTGQTLGVGYLEMTGY
ncbi:hypothetical protein A9Q81_17695 [Gammaproteobacteria bacterium 42_54_T18]|nr:hypothetical protein A9Q81_17695 [Gammaproteobacteria bacterium 42_54_T18]